MEELPRPTRQVQQMRFKAYQLVDFDLATGRKCNASPTAISCFET